MAQNAIVTSPTRWFLRGFLVGVLLAGTANALSYVVRSGGWGNLLGRFPPVGEAIGFPIALWGQGNPYSGNHVEFSALAFNVIFGVCLGTVIGILTLTQTRWLNLMVADLEAHAATRTSRKLQFSLRGLMLATFLAALFSALARTFASRPELLAAIYLLGPASLVILAMLPRHISWEQRVAILTPAALILIAMAVAVGISLGMEFDKVLMGIFVCWVPQSVLAAIALSSRILLSYYRRYSRAEA